MKRPAAGWKTRAAPGVATREANAVRLRNLWEELAAKVRSACSLDGALADPVTVLALRNLVAATGRGEPPFEAAPVRDAAAGFRLMVRALAESHPERRAAMADAMVAGARLVDGFLTEERTRAAGVWKHRSGGD